MFLTHFLRKINSRILTSSWIRVRYHGYLEYPVGGSIQSGLSHPGSYKWPLGPRCLGLTRRAIYHLTDGDKLRHHIVQESWRRRHPVWSAPEGPGCYRSLERSMSPDLPYKIVMWNEEACFWWGIGPREE